jgi:hypothetical protein
VHPRSLSVSPAATASVLENGISTATRTHAITHFFREHRHPPQAAPKSMPALPPSLLTTSRPRPRCARRHPRANCWDPAWATSNVWGAHLAQLPPEQVNVPSIRLAAGSRIVQAPGLPPAPASVACRAVLQSGSWHGLQFVSATPSSTGDRFKRAWAHIPGIGHNSHSGLPRPAHASAPQAPLHLHGHFGKLPRARISVLRILLTVATPSTRQCQLLDMFFFVHEPKLSLNLPQPFKEWERAAKDFCRFAIHTQAWSSPRVEGLSSNCSDFSQPLIITKVFITTSPLRHRHAEYNEAEATLFHSMTSHSRPSLAGEFAVRSTRNSADWIFASTSLNYRFAFGQRVSQQGLI